MSHRIAHEPTHMMSSWRPPARLTIPALLRSQAEAHACKTALHFDDCAVTYPELLERATSVANGLADLGVGPGDSVAVQMRNCAEMVYTWLATALLGAVYVPVNTAYSGEYLRHQLAVVRPKVAVVDEHLTGNVVGVLAELPSIQHIVVRGDAEAASSSQRAITVHTTAGLLSHNGDKLTSVYEPRWTDPNAVVFTAGTTGPSKGALMTQNYLVRAASQLSAMCDARPDDVFYSPLPMFHLNAMLNTVVGPLTVGATSAIDERFSVSRFWERVEHFKATQLSLLGPLVMMLWSIPPRNDDADNSARVMMAVPIPADLHRPIEQRYGLRIVVAYGLSECVPVLVSSFDDPPPQGSSGRGNPLFDVRLFDDDDQEVAPGQVGEIVCRPLEAHIMSEGYINDTEATTKLWRNLWFHTGDLGRADEAGFIFFVDRKKDYLRRRGENISSFEVERAVSAHPAVVEAAAFGVPSDIGEDELMITVVVDPVKSLTPHELMDHCVQNIPYFAVPRYIDFVSELPRNPVGRVQKFELKKQGVTPSTWDRTAAGYEVKRSDRK